MNMEQKHQKYMDLAYQEAIKAFKKDEVPVGAILVKNDRIIAKAHNLKERKQLATKHAEIVVIEKASKKLRNWHLDECSLYVTLEPCAMCAGAIMQSRIKEVIYGAKDKKGGAIESTLSLYQMKGFNHYPQTMYYEDEKCSKILSTYFKNKRNKV